MSDEQPNPYDQKVHLVISKDAQNDALQNKLDEKIEENKELSNKLEQIASIEFSKRCLAVGIDPAVSSTYDLTLAEENKKLSPLDLHGQSGDTAMLNRNQIEGFSFPSDVDDIPISLVSAENPETLISIASAKASKGDKDSQQILNRLTGKIIKGNNKLDLEFQGSSKDFLRNEKIINEYDSAEVKQQKEAFNNRLRRNRTNWKNTIDY